MAKTTNIKDDIDYKTIDNVAGFIQEYDKDSDTLTLCPKVIIPSISVDFNGDFWVRVDTRNGSIVGVDIEDYKEYFAKKYSKYLRGRKVTDKYITLLVLKLLEHHAELKPYTKGDYLKDLDKVVTG